jgi:hypothetical protein
MWVNFVKTILFSAGIFVVTVFSYHLNKGKHIFRLSKVAGDKLRDDNPSITDLSDVNRPTKLAEHYKELYDNEWTNAYEALQNKSGIKSEEEIIKKLGKMLKVRETT